MLDFDMGKYAGFVWPAYAVTVLVLSAMVADSLRRARRWRREVGRLQAQSPSPPDAQP